MKKIFAIAAAGLFAAGMASPAAADCAGHGLKTAQDGKGPMTTAMDTKPTPKPATTKSGS